MSAVKLNNLTKSFSDGLVAVNDLDLEIRQGEFVSLLGPSGCGKTTTLRMIAGLELPTSGNIFFDDRDVTYLKPNRRNTGMVFQNFALFPHMTVFQNVAFGLQARRVTKPRIAGRVQKALTLVDLAGFHKRKVTELSGGQQQRVALARAIVIEPEILLLDEPLSNLDAKLREETRKEIKSLQKELGITTIYVTHDQEEALTLSDRIAVMKDGVCRQFGTPQEVYAKPVDSFVAKFVGNANILTGQVIEVTGEQVDVKMTATWNVRIQNGNQSLTPGGQVTIGIRPEHFSFIDDNTNQANTADGRITDLSLSGSVAHYTVEVGDQTLQVRSLLTNRTFSTDIGSEVTLSVEPEKILILS